MGDDNAMNVFTNELMWALSAISKSMRGDKIGLVAVPPSKVGKESSIRKSIQEIMIWYKATGELKNKVDSMWDSIVFLDGRTERRIGKKKSNFLSCVW